MGSLYRYSSAALGRLRIYADWRCLEPVVVFESDDWGLKRRSCAAQLAQYGIPRDWADEDSETEEDLERLYSTLEAHRDALGRAPSIVANFVVANPDFDAIVRGGFQWYFEIPIDQEKSLRKKWLEGMERKVFFPQYHARYHFSVERWLDDLQKDVPGARALCAEHCHGGLSLIQRQAAKYHSEYLDWHTGREPSAPELDYQVKNSLDLFQRVFGIPSLSTIAPHYLCTPRANAAWRQAGIRYQQSGTTRILRCDDGSRKVVKHALGECSPDGILYLTRNAKFDPRPQRPEQGLASALEAIRDCFQAGVPAVVDTHRINFTGSWREQSLRALDDLLTAVRPYQPRFLTTVELGEAIEQGGDYTDAWTGERRRLTPLDSMWRRGSRDGLGRFHALRNGTF